MSPHEAAKVLTEHNRYRRGQAPYEASGEPLHAPAVIGEAIDTAIAFIRKSEHSTGKKARRAPAGIATKH